MVGDQRDKRFWVAVEKRDFRESGDWLEGYSATPFGIRSRLLLVKEIVIRTSNSLLITSGG